METNKMYELLKKTKNVGYAIIIAGAVSVFGGCNNQKAEINYVKFGEHPIVYDKNGRVIKDYSLEGLAIKESEKENAASKEVKKD